MLSKIKEDWFSNIGPDLLSVLVIGLVLIPETIGFAFIAGVDPSTSFLSVISMSIMVGIFGGRKGMISASAGSMALILAVLVRDYGTSYIMPVTLMTGVFQIIFGICKAGKLVKYIPESVMHGFVNALGILIFVDQIHYFKGQGLVMYILVGIGILVIYTFPYLTKKIPPAIISIIVVTIIALLFKVDGYNLGTLKGLELGYPKFLLPTIAINAHTIGIILMYSISLAIVGSVESLLTAKTLDEMTNTESNKSRECIGQGLGNILTAFIGGMAGCALVGQSIINTKSGGRTRLSTFFVGIFFMIYIVFFIDIVKIIPIAAVIAVMVMIAITTVNWKSIYTIPKNSITETIVMIVTVAIVLATSNLAIGVVIGVILHYIFVAFKKRKTA